MTARRPPLFLLLPAIGAAIVALLPLWYLLDRARSRGFGAVRDELWQRRTFDLVVRSSLLTGFVTILCLVVGVIAAWLVERSDLPARRTLRVLFALPLAVPSFVSAYAWVSWRPSLAGFWGASLVLVAASYPYVYLPVGAALRRLDPAQEEVARSLGWNQRRIAFRLTLRQLRPSMAAGGLLVSQYVLSDFGAVATMRYEAFTWVIYGAYRAGFNPTRAAVLAVVLVGVSLALVAAEAASRGVAEARVGSGTARAPRAIPLGRYRVVGYAFVATVLGVTIAFPVLRVASWVVFRPSADFDTGVFVRALGATMQLAGLAAGAVVLLAVPVGILAARFRRREVRLLEGATSVGHALPGIVVAISMVFVGVKLLRPVYQEIPLLVLAYAVLFLPLLVGTVRSTVEQIPLRLEEVARSLGKRPWQVVWRVTVPLAAPGVAAGTALVFLATMKELPATLLLRPTTTETLATRLWTATSVSDFAAAAPYALALMVFAALPTALLVGLLDRRLGVSPT